MRVLLAAVFALTPVAAAEAHHAPSGFKYDAFCCNGDGETGDCQPIPSDDVTLEGANYKITLKAGDHRLATREHVVIVPQAKSFPSPDGLYHLCLFPNEDTLRCFYAPPMNF